MIFIIISFVFLGCSDNENLWFYKTEDFIVSKPIFDKKCIYARTADDYLHCIQKVNGELIWKVKENLGESKVFNKIGCNSLLLSRDKIAFCYTFNLDMMYKNDGSLIWEKKFDYPVVSIPAVFQKKIFVADFKGNVYSIDFESGKIGWTKCFGKSIFSNLQVNENGVFVVLDDTKSKIMVLDLLDGKEIWSFESGEEKVSIFLNKSFLYLYNMNKKITCLDSKNGKVLWTWKSVNQVRPKVNMSFTYDRQEILSYQNYIFVTINDGFLYCLDSETGDIVWQKGNISNFSYTQILQEHLVLNTSSNIFLIDINNGEVEEKIFVGDDKLFGIDENMRFYFLDHDKILARKIKLKSLKIE